MKLIIRQFAKSATAGKYKQPDLIDTGRHSRKTRAEAHAQALVRGPSRNALILDMFRRRGPMGYTRSEIADALNRPAHCITQNILALLRADKIVETDDRRHSSLGGLGAVMQLAPDRSDE